MNEAICKCNKAKVDEEPVNVYPSNYRWTLKENTVDYSNGIRTTKYRWYSFLFLNLFEQFKRYSNLFFLLCVILNFIPQTSAFSKETAALPLLFVLLIPLFKDGYEDLQRFVSDQGVNQKIVRIYDASKKCFDVGQWQDVKVGDMVKVSCNERIPADLALYYSSDTVAKTCYLETSDIDGETNLKMRNIASLSSSKKFNENDPEKALAEYFFVVEPPNKDIYKFSGKIIHGDPRKNQDVQLINNTHIALRDTILRNTEEIRGVVIYAGNKTKVLMNNKKPRYKRSLLEDQLNVDNLWCMGILLIVCLMSAVGHAIWYSSFQNVPLTVFLWSETASLTNPYLNGFLVFWTSVIIYQSIIPLPLYFTMELVKAHQVLHMKSDLSLYNKKLDKRIEVKAFNITEDLGQINHVFCDKTGTLTQNDMTFRRASIQGVTYGCRDDLKLHCIKSKNTMESTVFRSSEPHKSYKQDFMMISALCNTTVISKDSKKEKKIIHLAPDNQSVAGSILDEPGSDLFGSHMFENITVLPIHPIQPVSIEMADPIPRDLINPQTIAPAHSIQSSSLHKSMTSTQINQKFMNAKDKSREEMFRLIVSESPDEDALVKMAYCNGYKLLGRTTDNVSIHVTESNRVLNYQVLKIFPFDSVRKCMSIILLDINSNKITLMCKGADSVIFNKIDNEQFENDSFKEMITKLKHNVDEFSRDGLRTLVLAKKNISEKQYLEWEERLKMIERTYGDDEERMRALYAEMECGLEIVGASGIEDKLQDNVPEVLECFKEAGINVWILTGDKQETAVNIAYSTKLFSKHEVLLEVNGSDDEAVYNLLQAHRKVIDSNLKSDQSDPHNRVCRHKEFGLIVDSDSLRIIMENKPLQLLFLHVTYFCNSVVCCRCTPIQKSEVVTMIKTNFKFRTLAVGDGANDVNMIQTADIGVGIGGKEGRQATMASDFAITEFQHLKRLLLVHGHWNYDRLAKMSLYIFYKDLFYSITLFLYQILCGFSGASAIDQITQVIFHIVNTGLPPLMVGIWEKDFDDRILMANPQIYKTGINSKMYRPRDFWRNVTDAFYQSIVVFLVTYLTYRESDIDMSSYGILVISIVVIIMFAQFIIDSRHWNPFNWLSVIGCLVIGFYLVFFILNQLCTVYVNCNSDVSYKALHYIMSQGKTYLVIFVTVSIGVLPRLFMKAYLSDFRGSISYEAQRRINKLSLSRTNHNLLHTRRPEDELDQELHYLNNHKKSIYYLGDLEQYKKMACRKCEYITHYFVDDDGNDELSRVNVV